MCAVVDLALRKRDKYVFYTRYSAFVNKPCKSNTKLTFSIWSLIDSSPDAMSTLIARNAAIRTSSSALDHSFRHVYSMGKLENSYALRACPLTFKYVFTVFRLLVMYGMSFALSLIARTRVSEAVNCSTRWRILWKYDRISF